MNSSTNLSSAIRAALLVGYLLVAARCSQEHDVWPVAEGPVCADSCPMFVYIDVIQRARSRDRVLVERCLTECLDRLMLWKEHEPERLEVLDVGGSRFTLAGLVFDLARDAAELTDRVGFCADAIPGHACRDRVWVFETANLTGRRKPPPSSLTRSLALSESGEVSLDGTVIGTCRFNDDESCADAVARIDRHFDDQHVLLHTAMFATWGDVATLLRALNPIRQHVWVMTQWDSLEQRLEDLGPRQSP